MQKIELVENFVYRSYTKASPHWPYDTPDRERRHPELLADMFRAYPAKPAAVITGSKGKGSLCCMLSSILCQKHRTGMLTSPHIVSFNERFRVDGKPISDERLVRTAEKIEGMTSGLEASLPDDVCISPMGIQGLIALEYFADSGTEFNVLECGKGARYDDIARIPHDYSAVNSVFLEHTRELGGTLEEIAEDKSFVIQPGQRCAYTAEQPEEVMEILRRRASETGVPLKEYGRDFSCDNVRITRKGTAFDVVLPGRRIDGLLVPLLGTHMAKNGAMAVCMALDMAPDIADRDIETALAGISWPGRMDIVSEDPLVILDACINRACCDGVLETLKAAGIGRVVTIIGIPADKDYLGVSEALEPVSDRIILTRSSNPHYVFSEVQADDVRGSGTACVFTENLDLALSEAKKTGGPVLVVGTTSLISDAVRLFDRV